MNWSAPPPRVWIQAIRGELTITFVATAADIDERDRRLVGLRVRLSAVMMVFIGQEVVQCQAVALHAVDR